jgi:glycosyltransferase involved in cell wall biosynthesis
MLCLIRWGFKLNSDVPLVCICVPTYNVAGTVRETLESILSQTYPNLIVHISDNASTDDTLKVVESINDQRLIIHANTENVGGEGNFNRCIQLAEGKYTAIYHADDIYEPDMVARQVAFLEASPEAGAVFTEASLINDEGSKIGEIRIPAGIHSNEGLYDFEAMFKAVLRHSNFFICPSAMARTKVYQHEIIFWRGELFRTGADLDVWLRILQRHPIGYLQEQLMRYRISENQWSARVRLATDRADYFLVTDHYMAQDTVSAMLTSADVRNLTWLERRDRVMRAINLLLTDQPLQARELLSDIFSKDSLISAVKTRRGLYVFFIGLYIELVAALHLTKVGVIPLRYMKKVGRK